jgi:hypothetical protein
LISLQGGSITAAGVQVQQGALLAGFGSIDVTGSGPSPAALALAGEFDVGGTNAAGADALTGNFSESSTGVLKVDVGGATAGSGFSQLNVSGTAALGGTLAVSWLNGFHPAFAGQTFPILTFASSTGTFAAVTGLIDPDPTDPYSLQVQYNSTNVSLVAVAKPTSSAPTVTALGMSTGTTAGGTSVTITGTNFTDVAAVTFGGVAASSFTVNSSTSITAVSPARAAGTVDVQVTTASGGTSATSAADQFTYTNAAAPAVTAVSPNSGYLSGGLAVTITGSGFTGATAVAFGSTPAASFQVLSDTSIQA